MPRGGHNIIEPARHGVAIVVGNFTDNFRDVIWLFQTHKAVRQVGPAELPLVFMELIVDDTARKTLGQNALETLRSQMGATEKTLTALEKLMPSSPLASSTRTP